MELKLNRISQYYYMIVLVGLSLVLAGSVFYHWNNGTINTEKMSSTFEASLRFDQLRGDRFIDRISEKVQKGNVRDAIQVMGKFERDLNKLDNGIAISEYSPLKKNISTSKKQLKKLISFPELSSIVLVLSNRVLKFERYVAENKWQTLTRIAGRVRVRITPRRVRAPRFFQYGKLSRLVKRTTTDLNQMIKITQGSVLSVESKNIIIKKVSVLKTEVNMLRRYLKEQKKFDLSYSELEGSFSRWQKSFGPLIAYGKLGLEKNTQAFLFTLLGLLFSIVFFLLGGIFIQKISQRKGIENVEKIISNVINNELLASEGKNHYNFSNKLKDELSNIRSYIHKRMSFGKIFEEGVPFPSILLDSNLKLSWGNELFYKSWGLDKNKESISWDYLQKFTNLGGYDPILAASKENLAGIYQVQLKVGGAAAPSPYEMYVSPIKDGEQTKILILFYPLKSLEETIVEQSKALLGPIDATLDALMVDSFNEEFQEKVAHDFSVAGAFEVFPKFKKYDELISLQRAQLLSQIKELEGSLQDKDKLIEDMKIIHLDKKKIAQKEMSAFNNLKGLIIEMVWLREEVEGVGKEKSSMNVELFEDQNDLLERSSKAMSLYRDNMSAFRKVTDVRDRFREFKENILDFRAETLQILDEAIVFNKTSGGGNTALTGHLARLKDKIKGYEKLLASFAKVSTELDVGLSKVDLIINEAEIPSFTELEKKSILFKEQIAGDISSSDRINLKGEEVEKKIVNSFEELVGIFKDNHTKLALLEELGSMNRIEDELPESDLSHLIHPSEEEISRLQ